MPLNPSRSLHFDSWEKLLQWLAEANENQLMTVFVWSGDRQAPGGDARRLAQVHKEAFEQLVNRTQERLAHYLVQRCHCRDADLAEDVVQQVLIKVYLRAEQFDARRSFWGWLYRIAHNEYIDTLRRLRPGDVGVGQAGRTDDDLAQWLDQQACEAETPETAALEQERRQLLDNAIAGLPSLQRAIVRLKRDGVKGKEIASQLGISQAYVSQLYHEAGEILREAIER
ncbi:MAG TPA: sigma-70 family RNA polymerase sigma factor [Gemmataceae bacterium]|jgi:RNA polymerase sigma-70 factor (ECF subfamily)|nr:sigma-70 family RNA polymerase sigma factor [Gemmataceae bacterium]